MCKFLPSLRSNGEIFWRATISHSNLSTQHHLLSENPHNGHIQVNNEQVSQQTVLHTHLSTHSVCVCWCVGASPLRTKASLVHGAKQSGALQVHNGNTVSEHRVGRGSKQNTRVSQTTCHEAFSRTGLTATPGPHPRAGVETRVIAHKRKYVQGIKCEGSILIFWGANSCSSCLRLKQPILLLKLFLVPIFVLFLHCIHKPD